MRLPQSKRLKHRKDRFKITGVIKMPHVIGYVLVVTEVGMEHEVVQELLKINGVAEAQTVYGEFDILCKIDCENLRSLDTAITKVRKIPSVIRTMTLISG